MTFHEYRLVPPDNRNSSDEDDDTMIASVDRDLGEHSARLANLERNVAAIHDDLTEVRDMMVAAKGGWKAIAIVSGIAGTAGGLLVKVLPWLAAAR